VVDDVLHQISTMFIIVCFHDDSVVDHMHQLLNVPVYALCFTTKNNIPEIQPALLPFLALMSARRFLMYPSSSHSSVKKSFQRTIIFWVVQTASMTSDITHPLVRQECQPPSIHSTWTTALARHRTASWCGRAVAWIKLMFHL